MDSWLAIYTLIHVVISLAGIAAGFVIIAGLLNSRRMEGWTAVFLVTTLATSLTGFGFPFERFLPSHLFGIIFFDCVGGRDLCALPLSSDGKMASHLRCQCPCRTIPQRIRIGRATLSKSAAI